jgi:hypothetical protein
MANDAFTQQALARDPRFLIRLQAALATVAWQVIGEDPQTPNHAERKLFARQVISNPTGTAAIFAASLVMRTNVFNFATTYDFEQGAVVTASGDADIESQLATDWNVLAGV